MQQLKEIEGGINIMRESFSKETNNMKQFQKGLLKFYRARKRLGNIVDIVHIISGSKEWKRGGKVADDILYEISYFEGIRKTIREIYEGKLPFDETKKFFLTVERTWCHRSSVYMVPGKNLLAEYRKAVMQYL